MAWWHGLIDWSPTIVPFQVTTCLGVTVSFLRSLPALPSVTLIPTSWTRRHSLSSPRAGQYSGSPPRRPYSSSLRSILSEGSPYMSSPIHSSLLPSFVPFSSIVTSWSSQTPSKYHNSLPAHELLPQKNKSLFQPSPIEKSKQHITIGSDLEPTLDRDCVSMGSMDFKERLLEPMDFERLHYITCSWNPWIVRN